MLRFAAKQALLINTPLQRGGKGPPPSPNRFSGFPHPGQTAPPIRRIGRKWPVVVPGRGGNDHRIAGGIAGAPRPGCQSSDETKSAGVRRAGSGTPGGVLCPCARFPGGRAPWPARPPATVWQPCRVAEGCGFLPKAAASFGAGSRWLTQRGGTRPAEAGTPNLRLPRRRTPTRELSERH